MRRLHHSSGDPIADRRAGYAEALAADHQFNEAAEVLSQALGLVPGWAVGWANLGRYREEMGDLAGAVEAWRQSAGLDAQGVYGAALKLVAHGVEATATGGAYVEVLFDDYAPRFERSLVDRLGYGVPRELMGLMRAIGFDRGTALDLGCGTGLMGVELRGAVQRLEGVDLSEAMLAEARRKDIYDRLTRADLIDFLATAEPAAVVTATDVLNYTGPLPPVLQAVHRILDTRGLFGFSLELNDGPEAVKLRSSLRYVHAREAALAACGESGFEVAAVQEATLRRDRGAPVAGLLVVARKL